MGISDRKEREKDEMRRHILDSAMKLFKENGFEEVSIRKIADLIEYSPTTIYLHFTSKDDILLALHEEGFDKLNALFKPLLSIKDPIERVEQFGHVYMKFGLDHPEYYDLMFLKSGPLEALEKEGHEEWNGGDNAFSYLVNATGEIARMHPDLALNPEVMATTLWSMVHGFVCLQLRNRLCWFSEDQPSANQMGFMGLKWLTNILRSV